MTPDQLCKSGSEHGEQRALFAWASCAERFGFDAAFDDRSYAEIGYAAELGGQPVAELRWMHAIPNGGVRDKVTASKLKAEGVKPGILDIFLPLPMRGIIGDGQRCIIYCGLYIEMKRAVRRELGRAAGSTSPQQDAFTAWARRNGFAVGIYFDWRSAANDIRQYVERCING